VNRQMPWVRVLGEGAVIVASILPALAADAWCDSRRVWTITTARSNREFQQNSESLERTPPECICMLGLRRHTMQLAAHDPDWSDQFQRAPAPIAPEVVDA
jgi:hypothetical protein